MPRPGSCSSPGRFWVMYHWGHWWGSGRGEGASGPNPPPTIQRKLKEATLAIELNNRYSKEQILEMYLNTIYYGSQSYGVEAAEREPWRHATRVRGHALVPGAPQAVPLEKHADALATLADAVQPPEEIEVLERRQLAVHERLVREKPDPAARGGDAQLAGGRNGETRAQPEQRRLPGAVRAGDDEEPAALELEVEPAQDALVAVALLDSPRANHEAASARTKAKKTTLITPLTVKKAASRRRRSPGRTSECP